MSAQFHRYRIARRSTANLSGDDLRDGLLGIIKNIVAATVLTLTTGAEVSAVKFALWLVVFPARSLTLALTA